MRVSYSAILAYRRTLAKVRPRATPGQHVVAAAVLPRHQPVIRFYAPTRTLRRKPPKKRSSNPGAHRYSRRDVAPAPEGGARQPQALPGNRRATSRFEPVSGSEDGGWRCDGEYRPPRTLAPGHRGYQEGHRACDRRSDDAPCRIEVLLCSGASVSDSEEVQAARRTRISASSPAASTSRSTRSIVTFCRLPERIPVTALRGRPERAARSACVSPRRSTSRRTAAMSCALRTASRPRRFGMPSSLARRPADVFLVIALSPSGVFAPDRCGV